MLQDMRRPSSAPADQLTQLRRQVRAGKPLGEVPPILTWAASNYLRQRSPRLSAHRRLSGFQWGIAAFAVFTILLLLLVAPAMLIVILSAAFTLYYAAVLALRTWFILSTARQQEALRVKSEVSEAPLPVITILVPLYREAASVPHLLDALDALIYPVHKLDIKILLEADDGETHRALAAHNLGAHIQVLILPDSQPRTKPKACNYGLWLARGTYTVIYDAEDRPEPDQLLKAARAFAAAPPDLACLQARLNYYNRNQSLLTRLFALEYTMLFDIVLPALQRLGAPLLLGGTSNFFCTQTVIKVGGWDAYNVTEDADIGLRLTVAGYRCEMLASTTWEEAVATPGAWLRQRSRWIKGYIQSWIVHNRYRHRNWRESISVHLLMGGVIVSSLINPLLWFLYIAWLSGFALPMAHTSPPFLLHLSVFNLVIGNLTFVYMFMIAPLKRRWYSAIPYALAMPLYWLLQCVAGYMALYQFIFRPFYWEKTDHYTTVEYRLEDLRRGEAIEDAPQKSRAG